MTPSLTSTASRLETPQATTFLPSPPASTTSASQCAGIPQFTVMALGPFDVIAEFQLTPAGFLAWHDEFIRFNGVGVGHPGPGVSPWPFTTGGDQPVTVCYLRGRFAPHGSQAPDGPTFADEAVAVLNGSSVELIAVGPSLPLVTPHPSMAIPSGCDPLPSAGGALSTPTGGPSFPMPSRGC